MPELDTPLHLDMYRGGKKRRSLGKRLKKALRILLSKDDIYGLEWGDPEMSPPLRYVRDHFLRPYISPQATVVEIGPGGGRWTRYMLKAKKVYAVDYHQELLDELRSNFRAPVLSYVKNEGDNFPGVPDRSVDLIFSFGAFVHFDIDLIGRYLRHMGPLLKPEANVVLQYSDKTKPLARMTATFSENDPDRMRRLVEAQGYCIYEEDTKTLHHSSLVRFGLQRRGEQNQR